MVDEANTPMTKGQDYILLDIVVLSTGGIGDNDESFGCLFWYHYTYIISKNISIVKE